jgi:hypothetical protein
MHEYYLLHWPLRRAEPDTEAQNRTRHNVAMMHIFASSVAVLKRNAYKVQGIYHISCADSWNDKLFHFPCFRFRSYIN